VPDHTSDELDRLREENEGLRQQVRRLRARGGEADLGYLFVVTYGRSGSTLVAGLLNTLPGYLIRGENRDAVHHLFRYHQTLLTESERASRTKLRMETHPFFGIGDFPAPRSLVGIRRLVLETVLRPKADTRVTGFKEIRWYHEDLEEYVAWLRQVFPGARFLVNTRDHADVLRSKWWAKGDPEQKAQDLATIERRILEVADDLGEAAYRIHYDDYVADPTVLRGLFDWLGEPWDEDTVRSVLAIRHSV
jgi:hypothetical protein